MDADRDRPLTEAMERFASGDAAAFAVLYRGLAPRLFPFCRRLAGHGDDPEDLFQEAFFKLHRARATFIAGSNVVHWAFAIARSVHLDRVRRGKRRPKLETSDPIEAFLLTTGDFASPEGNVSTRELAAIVDRTLAGLPEPYRAAFVLTKEEGLSVADTAAILATTENAVKIRVLRVREAIREALGRSDRSTDMKRKK
jgi:RNA polymerase sigma-70 factor (ECF subfamily)